MAWEAQFLYWLQTTRSGFFDGAMAFMSLLAEYGIFGIILGLILLISVKTRRTGCEVLLAMLTAFIMSNLILKLLVARVRPYDAYAFLRPLVEKPRDSSFPSGHTTNAFACATAIFLNHRKAGACALVIAALVAFSRLYNCVHYPTDVLTGVAVGVIFAILTHYCFYPAYEKLAARIKERMKT